MVLKVAVIGFIILLLVGGGVREWARATTFGVPRWPAPEVRPCECEICHRRFPYLNPEALPKGMEALEANGLLVLHVRAQHYQLAGYWHGRLPKRKRGVVVRPPPEVWHAQRQELLTEEQWRRRWTRRKA